MICRWVTIAAALAACSAPWSSVVAQVEAPNRSKVFSEDTREAERQREIARERALRVDEPASRDLDVQAPQVQYDREKNLVNAQGGVLISSGGVRTQSDSAEVNMLTKDARLEGSVLFSGSGGEIASDTAQVNIPTETGTFTDARVTLQQNGYQAHAAELEKYSDTEFRFKDALFSTCDCVDGSTPWDMRCSSAEVEQEGYAHTYNTTLNFHDVPLFYLPYLAFPVKTERASGLLVPKFGYSSKDGALLSLPLYWVLSNQSDLTLTPFVESNTRVGSRFEYRHAFSRRHSLHSRFVYSNESERDGELRGLQVTPGVDPSEIALEENRYGWYLKEQWVSPTSAEVPMQFLADIHYAGDDLFLREMEEPRIGDEEATYTSSAVVLRIEPFDFLSAELLGEYNQEIKPEVQSEDDLVLQRLPQFSVNTLKSFRPFGMNPYGVKLATRSQLQIVNFARREGYDGTRMDFRPDLRVPFHYENYFQSEIFAGVRYTSYDQSSTDPTVLGGEPIKSSADRVIGNVGGSVSTALERVFELPEDGWFSRAFSMGAENAAERLVRAKHVIQPSITYNLIPDVEQDDLPFYDSVDRIRERSLFTFGLKNVLYGRYLPPSAVDETIEELAPRVEDLPLFGASDTLGDFFGFTEEGARGSRARRGTIREIVALNLRQSYDYFQDQDDDESEDADSSDPGRDAWSDLRVDLTFTPSKTFAFSLGSDYDVGRQDPSSWSIAGQLRDDRGDVFRARYSYVEEQLSQIEGNIELALLRRLKLGVYSRYDEMDSEFLETRAAFRIISECECWHIDLGVRDRLNPNRTSVLMSFTFGGLGDITQDFLYRERNENS